MTPRCSILMFALIAAFMLARSSSLAAQDSQDNQPHVEPRNGSATPTPKPKPSPQAQPQQPQPDQPSGHVAPPPQTVEQGESSSKDSQVDFSGASRSTLPSPSASNIDDKSLRPWDPHRAAKDVEVGEYYLKLKNYRAALERFNDALLYKPNDADATFDLAVTQEKLDLFVKARQNYSAYLTLLPAGPKAKESQEGLKRLQSRVAVTAADETTRKATDEIEAGETYLTKNSFDAARERFEDALRLTPDNPRACFRLAQSLQGLERPEPARLYYQKYLELDPHGPYAADARKAIADINAFVGK